MRAKGEIGVRQVRLVRRGRQAQLAPWAIRAQLGQLETMVLTVFLEPLAQLGLLAHRELLALQEPREPQVLLELRVIRV